MTHAIVACARGWIGTRFHHQGRIRKTGGHKGGVDCLGLLVGVAQELRLLDRHGVPLALSDERDYSHAPDAMRLREVLSGLLTVADEPAEGDVVLLEIDNQPQHLGIISDFEGGLGLIHAYAQARAVVEHGLDALWRARVEAVFRVL